MADSSVNPMFTEKEVLSIREGINGVKHVLPSRFYTDETIYRHEVEHVLKKNWLFVGRWDQAENPGDYFTFRMWGQSIIIVRDKQKQLHALVNVCQHRYSQVVEDGSGNTNMFMCPYHRWTYDLDGRLKNISIQDIPGVDKKKCALPSLRVEEWQGFIFINYDPDAKPLAPQLEGLDPLFDKFQLATYRQMDIINYQTVWNYKCGFENGFEGYHHVGLHHRIHHIEPSTNTRPMIFGKIYGSYNMWLAENVPEEIKNFMLQPFGRSPLLEEGEVVDKDNFVGIYPSGPMMYVNNYQCSYLITHHESINSNQGATGQAIAPWAIDTPGSKEIIAELNQYMREIQDEDTFGCTMLQKGMSSGSSTNGLLHPLEVQLNHYHNWYMNQMMKS